MCTCNDLTRYDFVPSDMRKYLGTYGAHFNKHLCDFAVSMMRKRETSGAIAKITPMSRDEVRTLLESEKITLNNDALYDSVYVANMCKADFLGGSIPDKAHQAKFVKEVIDDPDGYPGMVFNRWYADMCKMGIIIDWEDML